VKIGIGSWTYGWSVGITGYPRPQRPLTVLDLLERARDFGVGVVQIADNLPVHELSSYALAELKDRAGKWNIEIEIGTAGVQPAHLMCYLDLARRLGAKLVRSLAGGVGTRPDLTQASAWLREALPAFEAASVCLALENYEGYTSAQLATLVRDIGSPSLGVCLDTVNSLGALETPATVVGALAPYVRSLHVKDFDIARVESRMGYLVTGRPAGEGLLDVDWLLAELQKAGSEPNLILELWTPYQGSVEETIRLEQDWADRSVRFLKRYAC
jgi:sugar phosphate isomerase/epimerase